MLVMMRSVAVAVLLKVYEYQRPLANISEPARLLVLGGTAFMLGFRLAKYRNSFEIKANPVID